MPSPLVPAFTNPMYQPAIRIITSITNGFPAIVTTSFAHLYLSGLAVRLYIPEEYGMYQANDLWGYIDVLSDDTFSIPIDTTFFDPFVVPNPAVISTLAQVVPFAEDSSQLYQAVRNVLSFNPIP